MKFIFSRKAQDLMKLGLPALGQLELHPIQLDIALVTTPDENPEWSKVSALLVEFGGDNLQCRQ